MAQGGVVVEKKLATYWSQSACGCVATLENCLQPCVYVIPVVYFGTSQMAVMLCGQEDNCRPGGK